MSNVRFTCSSEWARHLGKEEIYKTVEPETLTISPDAKRIYFSPW